MFKYFNSFEEINAAYPLDGKSSLKFVVTKNAQFFYTKTDLEILKQHYPYGWVDTSESRWYYYNITKENWYDTYIYDGEKWGLGINTWDGICDANEPDWGFHEANSFSKVEFGIFKTLKEAEEYCNKKLKERLEF